MKLYYSPFACSQAAHIACREAGFEIALERVELASKRVEGGDDLFNHNPMGQVPVLVLDDGRTLTENVAVLTYLADRSIAAGASAYDRYELTRWLSFLATELHKKVLASVFAPNSPDAVKDYARAGAPRALGVLSARLVERETLLDGTFSVADAFLFWVLTLMPHAGVPLDGYPALTAFRSRHRQRPGVVAAVAFEREQQARPFAA